ncbi:hypothetical protein [Lacinutrix himadriensis]|uniref:hypothetical protein n=1 Tax=Lacinutrix himadriensis TaxID=641549 RepID=UPI0006E25725|nr:hypothetical protein [Lacinutrix himadriensis]
MKTKLLLILAIVFLSISQAHAQVPINDECANAQEIILTTTDATLVATETTMATQSLIASCENTSQTWLDTWYYFTMPVNGNVSITSADFYDVFTLYANCADSMLATPVEINCSNDDTFYYNLIGNTTPALCKS